MRTKINELEVYRLEKKNPGILFIPSAADGVYFATSADDDRIGIVTVNGTCILTEKQAHAVAKEIREVCAMYIGRGRVEAKPGRWHL